MLPTVDPIMPTPILRQVLTRSARCEQTPKPLLPSPQGRAECRRLGLANSPKHAQGIELRLPKDACNRLHCRGATRAGVRPPDQPGARTVDTREPIYGE